MPIETEFVPSTDFPHSVFKDANNNLSKSDINTNWISKPFLAKALRQEAQKNGTPTPSVISYSVENGTKPGDNYMSTIYSITVEITNASKTRRHLLLKCYPSDPGLQQMLNKMNLFHKELKIYREWVPALEQFQLEAEDVATKDSVSLPFPSFVYGECIDFQTEEGQQRALEHINPWENFIILEDVRKASGFQMPDKREPLDLDHMRLLVQSLAEIHALSWAFKQLVCTNILEKFPCLKTFFDLENTIQWQDFIMMNLGKAKSIYDEEFGQGNPYSKGVEKYKAIHMDIIQFFLGLVDGTMFERHLSSTIDPERFGMDSEDPEWKVISHGDIWINNVLFRYDESTRKPNGITLVDLQMAKESCLVLDLQYAVYTCTDLAFRKNNLDELLQNYYERFNKITELFNVPNKPGFSIDALKYRFHRAKFLGYFIANLALPLMFGETEITPESNKDDGLCKGKFEVSNKTFKTRLIEVAKEMYEDGIL